MVYDPSTDEPLFRMICESLARIERKLDDVTGRVDRHDGALWLLRWIAGTIITGLTFISGYLGFGSRH